MLMRVKSWLYHRTRSFSVLMNSFFKIFLLTIFMRVSFLPDLSSPFDKARIFEMILLI